ADAVGGRPAHAQQGDLSRPVAARAATDGARSILTRRVTQEHQRVLAGVAGNRTELVQELALLASAGPRVAWRQSPRQVMPTGLLHALIVISSGRIRFEATATRRVGKILKQRAPSQRAEQLFYRLSCLAISAFIDEQRGLTDG